MRGRAVDADLALAGHLPLSASQYPPRAKRFGEAAATAMSTARNFARTPGGRAQGTRGPDSSGSVSPLSGVAGRCYWRTPTPGSRGLTRGVGPVGGGWWVPRAVLLSGLSVSSPAVMFRLPRWMS